MISTSRSIHTPIGPNRLTLQPGQPVPELSHGEQNVGVVSNKWISLILQCSLDPFQVSLWSAFIRSDIFMRSDGNEIVNTLTKVLITVTLRRH